jgi:hypothetical protein
MEIILPTQDVFIHMTQYLSLSSLVKLSYTAKPIYSAIHENEYIWKNIVTNRLKKTDLELTNWKEYLRKLICVFDNEELHHHSSPIVLNTQENQWTNRSIFDFSKHEELNISLDFYLDTGDSEILVAFTPDREESYRTLDKFLNKLLLFRISGESDMTGMYYI